MAFDEVQFPLQLAPAVQSAPEFMTDIITIDGGYEKRNQLWSQARRRYDARMGIRSVADANALMYFFQARAGRARGFRLKDIQDYTSNRDGVSNPAWNDQVIGVGDGTRTVFQLIKNYGSGGVTQQRDIRKPVSGTVLIGVNGAATVGGWSVNTTNGLVTFSSAPNSGHVITAGYQFDVPVRFDNDKLNLTSIDARQSQAEITLVEVRPE